MAVVYNKLLAWYVTTLELRVTVESRLLKKSTYVGEIVPAHEPRPPRSEWVISIEEKLTRGRQDNAPGSWENLSIYRIPRHLKHGEDKAWVPQIVSLGPYHHGDKHLRHMERHKWRCLHRILERSSQEMGLYLDSVKKVEQRARACYEGRISMSPEEFVEMMILDGCFVIEMFRGFTEGFKELGYPPNDPVFSMRRSILQIQWDMIMLENQIPLFILDRLLDLQLSNPDQKKRVAKLAIKFFELLMPNFLFKGDIRRSMFHPLYDHGMVHCLEVFQRSYLQLGPKGSRIKPWSETKLWSKTEPWSQSRQQLTRCLTKLQENGVKIMLSHSRILGEIKFKDGILRIPRLQIHEKTRSLFLNLIAFEQSHFKCSNYITSYVIFMHNLINSAEEVQYLRNHQIIEHCLGSDAEVVDLFRRLCQEVAFDIQDSYLFDAAISLSGRYTAYCHQHAPMKEKLAREWITWKVRGNAWVAILKNKYFDNPWSIISFIAGVVLLVLAFIQAFYAVYTYYRRPS